MGNFCRDNDDIRFYMDEGLRWGPLVELTEYGFADPDGFENTEEAVELYRDILDMVGDFVAQQIAPAAGAVDRAGVTLKDGVVTVAPETVEIFEQIKELDLHGMCVPRAPSENTSTPRGMGAALISRIRSLSGSSCSKTGTKRKGLPRAAHQGGQPLSGPPNETSRRTRSAPPPHLT